jgi:hypothetical protein
VRQRRLSMSSFSLHFFSIFKSKILEQKMMLSREKILDGFEFKKHIDRAAELNPRSVFVLKITLKAL